MNGQVDFFLVQWFIFYRIFVMFLHRAYGTLIVWIVPYMAEDMSLM